MTNQFRDFKIRGESLKLKHLLPMRTSWRTAASPDARTRLLVTFSSHCFSEDYVPGRHTPDLLFKDDLGRKRAFDRGRYEASLALPEIFETIWDARVAWTRRKNYVLTLHDGEEPYSIFFNLMASNSRRADVHCLVQSAYYGANLARHEAVKRFTFSEAVDTILERTGRDMIGAAMAKVARGERLSRDEDPEKRRARRRRHEAERPEFEHSDAHG